MSYNVCGSENHLLRNDKRRNVVIPLGARKHMKEMFRMKGILWVTDQKCQSVQWLVSEIKTEVGRWGVYGVQSLGTERWPGSIGVPSRI